MYFIAIIALTFALPLGAAIWQILQGAGASQFLFLLGAWTAFFATGVRLFLSGLRQVLQPKATLKQSFEVEDEKSQPVMQELGFANLAMGALGLLALVHPMLTFAAALVGGFYYGLAGVRRLTQSERNAERTMAMFTDFWVLAVLALYLVFSGLI